MMNTTRKLRLLAAIPVLSSLAGPAIAGDYPMAGLQPSQRPAGAPTIIEVRHDDAWFKQASHGLSAPYPASLHFLEDQGNWYTPFTRPGMTGRYDIRHWHGRDRNG